MRTVKIEKQVPIVGSYDVVVCGGGPAGFIAAITAAREGARTALIERYGFLGGMATAGYVSPISEFKYGFSGSAATGSLNASDFTSFAIFVVSGGITGTECQPVIKIDNIRAVSNK